MGLNISVIICTYNPEEVLLARCLESVDMASRVFAPSDVLIIDNNSKSPVSEMPCVRSFLAGKNQARVVVEAKQGLTPARLRGIEEAMGELLVFVDDDNILTEDYFREAASIAASMPMIGAFSGQVLLEFEKEPPEWTRPYWGLLVYRKFDTDHWSNLPHLFETMPCGAGLCVRKDVAAYYQRLHLEGKRAMQLDRTGNSLFSGGDNDLSACACDIGLGVGLFQSLVVHHVIPSKRTEKEYLLKLTRGIAASSVVMHSFRNDPMPEPSVKNRMANMVRGFLKKGHARDFFSATLQGEKDGREMLRRNSL